jgi:hypothetical protein
MKPDSTKKKLTPWTVVPGKILGQAHVNTLGA